MFTAVASNDAGLSFTKVTIDNVEDFFFQAEDGIRDVAMTGVQTCALPIYPTSPLVLQLDLGSVAHPAREVGFEVLVRRVRLVVDALGKARIRGVRLGGMLMLWDSFHAYRSEERRVGKECGDRSWERA